MVKQSRGGIHAICQSSCTQVMYMCCRSKHEVSARTSAIYPRDFWVCFCQVGSPQQNKPPTWFYTAHALPAATKHRDRLKRRRDLEREKDVLWAGLEVVEQTQLWYQTRLQLNSQRHLSTENVDRQGRWSCALRSSLQRVNGSLGSLMTDSSIWINPEENGGSDWDIRWSNAMI
ncbi:uncharacterized protein isoform X1 [Danio rerio]|uniref:Uncharacterized protein isoform X1 n=1 Tax=Danio rerio TaxID=7955 RepID=A0AC58JF56_DANRE